MSGRWRFDSGHGPHYRGRQEHNPELTRELGQACLDYQHNVIRNLTCKRIQCDEIWNFCYCKDKNLPDEMRGEPGVGSMWTWTALCTETKLIVSWRLGARDSANANVFMGDVAARVRNRFQLTTDGNNKYLDAVSDHFWPVHRLRPSWSKSTGSRRRIPLQPRQVLGYEARDGLRRTGPGPYLDQLRRAPEPEYQNAESAVHPPNQRIQQEGRDAGLQPRDHVLLSQLRPVHQTIKTTPAVKAGIAQRKWTIEDMLELLPLLKYNTPAEKAGLLLGRPIRLTHYRPSRASFAVRGPNLLGGREG